MNNYYKTKKLAVSTYVLLFLCLLAGWGVYSLFQEDGTVLGYIYIAYISASFYVISSIYTLFFPIFKESTYDIEKGVGKNKLVFRFVSKGKNVETLTESVNDLFKLLKGTVPIHLWKIEVVVDAPVLINKENVNVIVVPDDYVIKYDNSETKYKARALHYACSNQYIDLEEGRVGEKDIEKETKDNFNDINLYETNVNLNNSKTSPSDFWVVHLDEETHLNMSSILELYAFSEKHPDKIGQGVITYMNKFGFEGIIHFFNTLSDSFRVTDDIGRFRLQYQLGIPLSGMKGSFIIVKNSIEKEIGFNYGLDMSITEDCHFALKAWEKGYKFGFVPAIMFERSPFTIMDFIRQRSRWYRGLWKVVFTNTLKIRYKLFLGFMMTLWTVSPLTLFILVLSLYFQINSFLNVLFMSLSVLYVYFYMYGCMFTLIFNNSFFLFFPIMFAQLLAIPYSSVLETVSVFYAWIEMLRKDTSFYVVKK